VALTLEEPPAAATSSDGGGGESAEMTQVRVLYDWNSEGVDIKAGEVVGMDREDGEWIWVYDLQGNYGAIPTNYTEYA
jgi:hypothetical protein